MIEAREGQVKNLLAGMEEMKEEVEKMERERDGLRKDLEEVKAERGEDVLGGGGELSLVEREELIRLRGEVAEYEGEDRQDRPG